MAAPLKPSDNVMTITTRYLSKANSVIDSRKSPGITCADGNENNKLLVHC